MDMREADRVFRQEMRKIRSLRKAAQRAARLSDAPKSLPARKKKRQRHTAAAPKLTTATWRDVSEMDRAFREACRG